MNMVFHAVQSEQLAIVVFNDAPDVTEQILAARFIQHALAVFSRENDVINDLCVGGQSVSGVLFDPVGVVVLIVVNRRLHLRLPMF